MYKKLTESNCKDFKYFKYNEFKCKCNKYCKGYPTYFSYDLVVNLENIRKHFNKPLIITSPLRCKKWNNKVGGITNSKHLVGQACDFYINGVSYDKIFRYIKKLPYYSYAYKINNQNVVHYQINAVDEKESYKGKYPKLPSRGYFIKGDSGIEVKYLQNLLNWANDSKIDKDGIVGDKTINEVKKIQKKLKINVDGKFGKTTLSKIKKYKK